MSNNFSLVKSDNDDAKIGLVLVGIVLLFLFCLVALKLCCNIMIDIIILRDGDSVVRTLSKLRRRFCPCWQPRTGPASPPSLQQRNNDPTNNTNQGTIIDMDNLLAGLTPGQKKELLASILTSKTATDNDILQWKKSKTASKLTIPDGNDTLTEATTVIDCGHVSEEETQQPQQHPPSQLQVKDPNNNLLCPICIHDIDVGETVCYSGFCHHVYHRDCLSAWLSTHSRVCPYCRQEILTQEMLEEAHRLKLERQESWEEDDDDNDDDDFSLDSFSTIGS
mmetsp:Transcript_23807/g.38794  ORF Transcript_23807/g.38794 Transcript_23807/m.38794 type:complete len:279 (-) Transcript_23807:1001-1837(-)|eukprot:CAMPEP_0178821006 /NCGR_PEP_ID=MMETSP0746-20121128/3830_1 /TAXON_ID=913974 /ORGANISM="Nitzschia punctata, Strain CCMP561" /LENGTH=278 /DNA_ID=CAMNT_0020482419 /DNA_START=9 /DNA_END=845 /DNA_ORIENTATION=+